MKKITEKFLEPNRKLCYEFPVFSIPIMRFDFKVIDVTITLKYKKCKLES